MKDSLIKFFLITFTPMSITLEMKKEETKTNPRNAYFPCSCLKGNCKCIHYLIWRQNVSKSRVIRPHLLNFLSNADDCSDISEANPQHLSRSMSFYIWAQFIGINNKEGVFFGFEVICRLFFFFSPSMQNSLKNVKPVNDFRVSLSSACTFATWPLVQKYYLLYCYRPQRLRGLNSQNSVAQYMLVSKLKNNHHHPISFGTIPPPPYSHLWL